MALSDRVAKRATLCTADRLIGAGVDRYHVGAGYTGTVQFGSTVLERVLTSCQPATFAANPLARPLSIDMALVLTPVLQIEIGNRTEQSNRRGRVRPPTIRIRPLPAARS